MTKAEEYAANNCNELRDGYGHATDEGIRDALQAAYDAGREQGIEEAASRCDEYAGLSLPGVCQDCGKPTELRHLATELESPPMPTDPTATVNVTGPRMPRMIVRIYRRDLVSANACEDGMAVYDAIAAMALAGGDVRATKRLRVHWTALHSLWLASAYPAYSGWLISTKIVPVVANLDGVSLVGASLVGANLDGANLDGVSLVGASLVGASLVGASLVGASLVGANLDDASLVGANLDGANLDGVSLVGASLVGANLDDADFDGANLDGANLVGANLHGASLIGVSLRGVSLVGASLHGADFDGANLDSCCWPKSRPAPAGWTHDPPVATRSWVVLRRAP